MTDADDPANRSDKTGRFLPGYQGGRKHRIDLLSVCARMAKDEGLDLDRLLWGVVKGLMVAASNGNTSAGRLVFQYMARDDGGIVPDAPVAAGADPALTVNVLNVELAAGPPVPPPNEMLAHLRKLRALNGKLSITIDDDDAARAAKILGDL